MSDYCNVEIGDAAITGYAELQHMILRHSIEINTSPEEIWNFLINLDQNYTMWHPNDHISFVWTQGNPLEQGARGCAKQVMAGNTTTYHFRCAEIVPFRKIVLKFALPVSILSPKIEWLIEPRGESTDFTAITYVRAGGILRKLFPRNMNEFISDHNRHVEEEAINLKRILEAANQSIDGTTASPGADLTE